MSDNLKYFGNEPEYLSLRKIFYALLVWLRSLGIPVSGLCAADETAASGASVPTSPAKGYIVNTPAIGTAAGDVLAASTTRKECAIQNVGTNTLYVRLGTGASTTEYHFALSGGAANDDGRGATLVLDTWGGVVSVAGTSPRYVTTEIE